MSTPARLVLHAAIAGLYAALALVVFLRLLHPEPPRLRFIVAMLPVAAAYTAVAAILLPLLYGLVRFFASHRLHVPSFSPRYAMTFLVVALTPILASIGVTLSQSRRAIDEAAAGRVKLLLAAVGGAWIYAGVVCLVPRLKRSLALQASAAGVALAALLAPGVLPAGMPGPDPARPPEGLPPVARRLVLLEIDGADLEDLLGLQTRGLLPSLSRLRREGTYGRLESLLPCEAAVVRTTLVTGQLPWRSGVRGPFERRLLGQPVGLSIVPAGLGFDRLLSPVMTRRRLTVEDRRGPALWDMVRSAGGTARAAGWEVDLDHPGGPEIPGLSEVRTLAAEFGEGETSYFNMPLATSVDLARALAADQAAGEALDPPLEGHGLVAVSLPGLDRVAHRFLRFARPDDFGNVRPAEVDEYGRVLERYYVRIDALVERARALAGPDGWLFVTSAHGIEPAPLRQRLLPGRSGGREALSGAHADGPSGFLFAVGPGVRAGQRFGRAALADVAPTALYLLGLPIARDLDGRILDSILDPEEVRARPVQVIDSYGPRPASPG
ncbi:MAG TPA: alkaline phosphatase family protein [Candidatus Polarisedimenticolia bacterium]|nr:alkaline phosphatase family protein [Candidatus Polarisedimenticolia bacterium]